MEADLPRVIIVDRHRLTRAGLRYVLTPMAQVVGEADDFGQCTGMMDLGVAADIVVADIGPQELAGMQLDQAVKGLILRDAGLLVVSRIVNPRLVSAALRAGARGYLLKDTADVEMQAALQVLQCGGSYVAGSLGSLAFTSDPERRLSPREVSVLELLGEGLASKEIARRLCISVRTVESHRLNLKRKLQVDGYAALLRVALTRRLSD